MASLYGNYLKHAAAGHSSTLSYGQHCCALCRPLSESVLQLVLQQLHRGLSQGETEARQASFEASGGLQLIQQLGTQSQTRLANLVQAINILYPEQVSSLHHHHQPVARLAPDSSRQEEHQF